MIASVNEIISELSASFAKILLLIGLIFVVLKIIDKKWNNQPCHGFYEKRNLLLYHLHINGCKFAIILAFVHGFTSTSLNQSDWITGWIVGIIMVILLVLGAILSIKNKSKPMNAEKDSEFDGIANQPKAGYQWERYERRSYSDISVKLLKFPEYQGISVHGILFKEKSPYRKLKEENFIDLSQLNEFTEGINFIRTLDSLIINVAAVITHNRERQSPPIKKVVLESQPNMLTIPSEILLDDTRPNDSNYFFLSVAVGAWLLYKSEKFFIRDNNNSINLTISPKEYLMSVNKGYLTFPKFVNLIPKDKREIWLKGFEEILESCLREDHEKLHEETIKEIKKDYSSLKTYDLLDKLKTIRQSHIGELSKQSLKIIQDLEKLIGNQSTENDRKGFL